ncbi:MAG: hypothetical protein LBD30_03385, partial [Verrucomicrobiales bacterium]|nr:hypothetical protein [Verrucomicrobiales bacterium]
GIADADGQRWEQSPSFFNRATISGRLSVSDRQPVIHWLWRDTLSGEPTASVTLPLSVRPEEWRGQLQKLPVLLLAGRPMRTAASPAAAVKISVAELENNLRNARGADINIALINLAPAAPASPLLVTYSFEKNDNKRGGVDGFLNHALRDYCLAKLPKDDRQRRWLELTQIYTHIGDNPIGRIYSGQKCDFVELLKNFVTDGDRDAPGLIARYSLLFNTQSIMPRKELVRKCDELLADLKNTGSGQFADLDKLAKYTESMQRLARIADGDTTLEFWTDTGSGTNWQPSPHCIRLSWRKDRQLPALDTFTPWVTNDMQFCPLTPEEKIREAQVALLFNGRGDFTEIARDEWLEKFPRSLTLTVLTADAALHEINYSLGLPIQHRFNGKAEAAAYLRQINYAADGLKFWLGRMASASQLDRFEQIIYRFITSLNERALLDIFSDEQYVHLQKELADAVSEANRRAGRSGWRWQRPQYVPWQTLTREQARRQSDNQLFNFQREILDRDFFLQIINQAEAATIARPGQFNPQPWWKVLRGDDIYRVFTQPEFAGFYRRLHSPTLALADGDLSSKELGGLFEQALALLRGGSRREAEELFVKIQNSAVTDLNRGYGNTLVRANAAFRLAQIYRMDLRLPEAVQQAQLGLQLCGNGSFQVISRRYEDQWDQAVAEHGGGGDLARQLAGLLRDLRFDPQRANLPERVKVVTVSTPNMDNPALRIFYRAPCDADRQRPSRVLVLGAGSNAEVISYLRPDSPWTKFADAHRLVLVMPQFRTSYWAWEKTDAYSYYSDAQVWSGRALLDGLEQINQQCAVQQQRLLFYAYGSNTGFALRFARWRPDLVAAVAVGRPSNFGTPRFAEPDLRPMSALKNVAFHLSAAEFDDDFCCAFFNRHETAVHFATLLQAADVHVEWKDYPGLTPPPAAELERDAREFLEKQLNYHEK